MFEPMRCKAPFWYDWMLNFVVWTLVGGSMVLMGIAWEWVYLNVWTWLWPWLQTNTPVWAIVILGLIGISFAATQYERS